MARQAIGYVRISTSDQSNFSLDGQDEYIRNYCARQGIELLSIFRDDGQSAKNFDRANWRELEAYIRSHFREVDYLIVCKYDRFSRNVADALAMIDKLEKKYSITVSSVMEPIALHPDSPYYFQFRTQMLLGADVELRVIRDRTRFGMVNAARSGRYVSMAPIGYKNARDAALKPIIIPDPDRAPLVRKIYTLFLEGMPLIDIQRSLRSEGLYLKGKSAVQRILTYPVYAGLIRVPAYYDEPERLVKGIHEAIVPEDTWWKVQAIFEKPARGRTIRNEAVPLRGVLQCMCGKCFTAGLSTGKTKRYWYYFCNTHRRENYAAARLHQQFDELVKCLQLPEYFLQELTKEAAESMKVKISDREQKLTVMQKDLAAVALKLDSLEEKYLDNSINAATYRKWRTRLENERYGLQQVIDDLGAPVARIWEGYSRELWRLRDIHFLYQRADLQGKQAFVRIVFDNSLSYSAGVYRTPFLLPIFSVKVLELKEKGLLVVEQPEGNLGNNPASAPTGNTIELFSKILEWAATVVAA